MVLSAVVPTSFVGVDFFDIMRFRFIPGHIPILLWETESGGRGDGLSFDLMSPY